MKKGFCISYDLKKPGKDYAGLYVAIKRSSHWWHYLDSTWLVCTSETPDQIWARLEKHVDKTDRVLIIEIRDNCQGWLPQDAWDWIHEKVPT